MSYSGRLYKRREDDQRSWFVIDEGGKAYWLVTNPACGKADYWHSANLNASRLDLVRGWIQQAAQSPMIPVRGGIYDAGALWLGARVKDASGKTTTIELASDGARRSRRGGEAGDSLVRWLIAVIHWKGHTFPECNSRPRPPPKP